MKLLHSEIDVVPGRKPQKQPLPEGFVGAGTGVLRIANTTSRQNSYTVRIKCDEPFWQDAWFQVSALPASGDAKNQPPAGKPDQPGPRNQSLTLFVQDGGTRDVFLSFFVPEKSECRSGAYPVKVIIETRIVSSDPQEARKERITELSATVIVRPFYKWVVSFQPEDRKVGFFRRGKEYEIAVDNQSNDWLYCDLRMPRPQNVLVESPTVRLAVPPPEPGADSVRTIPFKAVSRVKTVRGAHQTMPLPITVQRVHAPTVPPLPEDAQFGPSGANTGAAVIATETADIGTPENPATLTYCPLIPATLTGFFQAIGQNFRNLAMMVIGAIIAYNLAVFTWKYFFMEAKLVNVSTTQVELNKPFIIIGKNLVGSKVYVYDSRGKERLAETKVVPQLDSLGEQRIKVTISDPSVNNKTVKIGVQRGGFVSLLDSFLPIEMSKELIDVGKPPAAPRGPAQGSTSTMVAPGQPLEIGGTNFGDEKGRVLLNGETAVIRGWNDTKIVVKIPQKMQDGNPITIQVVDSKGNPIPVVPQQIAVGSSEPPPDTAGGPGPIPGTSGTSGTEGGSGGTGTGPAATSGGTEGGSGGTGTNPGTAVAPPPGADKLLGDSRADYVAAVSAARGNSGGALAVKAYALASIGPGKLDEARQTLLKANSAIGNGGPAEAMYYLALARITEKLVPEKADEAYAKADEKANQAAPNWAFVDIAIARYKIAKGSWTEAEALLKDAATRSPSPAETSAIDRMSRQVAGRSRSE